MKIAADIFEMLDSETVPFAEQEVKHFVEVVTVEATDQGRALYNAQMAFRDKDDPKAPFRSLVAGEVIPIFTLLFSRSDFLEPEEFFDHAYWSIDLNDPATWHKANELATSFAKGDRPLRWWHPDYMPKAPELPEPEPVDDPPSKDSPKSKDPPKSKPKPKKPTVSKPKPLPPSGGMGKPPKPVNEMTASDAVMVGGFVLGALALGYGAKRLIWGN